MMVALPRRVLRRARRRWRRVLREGRAAALARTARILRAVRPGEATEQRLLRWSWISRDAGSLDEYLVVGWQNPRINMQSILLRHALVRRLFGEAFEELMAAEIGFAIELNKALRIESERTHTPIYATLNQGLLARVRKVGRVIAGRETEFQERWRTALADRVAAPISVLELACGSANDYRAFADYGLARFLAYTGIDLNPKNVANARRRFPSVDFRVGNAMAVERGDASVDVVIASDLFEHLPIDVAARVLAEAMRVAKQEVLLVFFNMAEVPDHEDKPLIAYHWNLLSRARVEATLAAAFPSVTVTPIGAWLRSEFGYAHSYNPRAYSFAARREAPRPAQTATPTAV